MNVTAGLKPGGWILINAPRRPADIGAFTGYHLACVDGTGIAIQNQLGTSTHPIINTAMIGAFARIMEMPALEAIADAIKEDILVKPQQNIHASEQAFENVRIIGMID